MKKRTANKIIQAVLDYKSFDRWDMPYNGSQIYRAAKTILPAYMWPRFKGWHKETEAEGKANFCKELYERRKKLNEIKEK